MDDNFEIKFVVICDDARREDNGKILIIGVYGSEILVSKWPANLRLSEVIFYDSLADVDTELKIEISLGDKRLMAATAHFTTAKIMDGILLLPQAGIKIEQPGTLTVTLWVGENSKPAYVAKREIKQARLET